MQALHGFPPTFSDGWKNVSISLVLSLSEMVDASGSESSDADRSTALGADVVGFAVVTVDYNWNQI